MRAAFEKWIALKPFDDPSAPSHPFMPGFYTPPFDREVREGHAEAARAEERSKATSHHASSYLSNTIILATVLSFAGTAGKFDRRRVRQFSLGFATTLFLLAVVRMLTLPVL